MISREKGDGIDWPVLLTVSLMPVQWIALVQFGNLKIKFAHLALLMLGVLFVVSARQFRHALYLVRYGAAFWMSISFYLLWSTLVTVAITSGLEGADFIRQSIYFAIWLLLASRVMLLDKNLKATFFYTGIAGLCFFYIAIGVSAIKVGLSPVGAIKDLFLGNLESFTLGFLLPMLNSFSVDVDQFTSLTIKNTIAGMLVMNLVVFMAGNSVLGRGWRRPLGWVVITFYLLTIPLLLSRSAIAIVLLIALLYALHYLVNRGLIFALVTGGLGSVIGGAVMLIGARRLLDVLLMIIFEREASYSARLEQYAAASALINDAPLLGYGGEVRVGHNLIHNLFLAAWAQAGIVAFLLAVIMYISVLVFWGRWLVSSFRERGQAGKFALWITALPVLPLFRVWIGGDGGNLDPAGWISLALFFGVVAGRQMRLAREGASASSSGLSRAPHDETGPPSVKS